MRRSSRSFLQLAILFHAIFGPLLWLSYARWRYNAQVTQARTRSYNDIWNIRGAQRRLVKRTDPYLDAIDQAIDRGEQFEHNLEQGHRIQTEVDHRMMFPNGNTQSGDLGWTADTAGRGQAPSPFQNPVYQALSATKGHDSYIGVENTKNFDNCHGTDLPPTGAEFHNIFNVAGRMIIGINNHSPLSTTLERGPLERTGHPTLSRMQQLPDVRYWSDIATILWKQVAGPQTGALKYIIKHDVYTELTKNIIREALGDEQRPWPGTPFPKGSTQFQALLGTPHGRGVYNMLFQHPEEFGSKSVESIRAFTERGTLGDEVTPQYYHLLFELTG